MNMGRRAVGEILVIASILVLSFASTTVVAQVGGSFPDFEWGARYKATLLRGVAFEDAFAPLHNPATVLGCVDRHVAVEQMRPFGVPVTAVAWCGGGLGGHLIVRQTPAGLGFDYNTYTVAASGSLKFAAENVSVALGMTPKLLLVSISGTETGHDDEAFGYGADLGLRIDIPVDARVIDNVSLTVAALDMFSELRYGNGAVEAAAEPTYIASMSVAGPSFTVGVTARQGGARTRTGATRWSIGSEYVMSPGRLAPDLLRGVVLRAGIGFGDAASGVEEAGIGFGVTLKNFGIDYSFTWKDEGFAEPGLHAITTRLYF